MNQFTDPVAEQEIVGAVLTDPDSFTSIRPIVTPEMFSNPKLETVYRTFSEQYEKNGLTDLATLAEISGVPGHVLVGCMAESAIPSLVHIKARKIADQFHKRHIQRQLAITIAQLGTLTPAEIAAALSNLAADVTIRNHEKSVFSPGELCKRVSALQKTREQERKEGRHQGAEIALKGARISRSRCLCRITTRPMTRKGSPPTTPAPSWTAVRSASAW